MKNQERWPEVLISSDFLVNRKDIISTIKRPEQDVFSVTLDHPVLGTGIEVYKYYAEHSLLSLKSILPQDMQEEEEMEIAKDYYNNYLLQGKETYIDCYNPNVGYFLLSRNRD